MSAELTFRTSSALCEAGSGDDLVIGAFTDIVTSSNLINTGHCDYCASTRDENKARGQGGFRAILAEWCDSKAL